MATVTPTRRPLSDLPVNTVGTPPTAGMMGKGNAGVKRQIHEVEKPEYAQPTARVRLSPTRLATSSDTVIVAPPAPRHVSMAPVPETGEDVGDADSQNSYKDSTSSLIDFDPDETMASQQTAATDVTQPLPPRARQHAETLRLRLRLAHFKVQTNQMDVPLSQLRLSTNDNHHQLTSPESTLAGQPSLPKLLPAPVLLPTAFSARTISRPNIASSPLTSTGNSPSKGAGDENLTSSAVRGKAVIGLLGLRQER